ncbi:MAG: glycoside hydrolase family 9 protein [Planctomycetota bacterium]|jgi:hypothetical protein|nr:glycoside hydrolase family 9 protein [Planctomycetota bacterium]MDP7250154.1 glycoside hydrolase family 9 protein [Planctomycetota bacterium]
MSTCQACLLKTLFASLTLFTVAIGEPYGFGKVVKLGPADVLVHNEFLHVYTADTVGFVFRMTHPDKNLFKNQPLEDAGRYSITEDGAEMEGIKVIGRYEHLYHMGHRPRAYTPKTWQSTVFVRLPRSMNEGKKYSFKSNGLGEKNVDVAITWSEEQVLSDAIKVNQIGYVSNAGFRFAYFGKWLGTAGALGKVVSGFSVIDLQSGKTVHEGKAKLRHKAGQKHEDAYKSDFSNENVYGLDLKAVKPGSYCISIPGVGRSYSFRIGDDVMAEPLFTSIRALFHERCGVELKREHTPWVRKRCKMHTKIAAYPEFGPALNFKSIREHLDKVKKDGTIKYVEVRGGYHDAGDYDRRPMHINIGKLLASVYEINPDAFIDNQFVIPESGNGIPDILDEAYFLLLYYLETQWPDGGISAGSEAWAHPKNINENAWLTHVDNEITEYVMLPASQLSCFSFAASAAHLGRLLKSFAAGKKKGERLVASAIKAFDCGMQKFPPKKQGAEILVADAAARLLYATQDARFARLIDSLKTLKVKIDYLAPGATNFAYAYCMLPAKTPGLDGAFQQNVRQALAGSYGWATNTFTWKKAYVHFKHPWAPILMGTHSTGQAAIIALVWKITGQQKFYDLLSASADACLGANPMGQVQCTGLGQKHALHPLFLESMNDDLDEYLPGLWFYGPGRGNHWMFRTFGSVPPAKQIPDLYRFIDIDQCPPQTEFTVTENLAPAVMIFGALAPKNPKPYRGPLPAPK